MAEQKEKPRLLIATDNFKPRLDGIAVFLAEIIPRLSEKYNITVLAPDFGPLPAEDAAGFKLIRMPTYGFSIGDFKMPRADKKIVNREVKNCDLVFSQTIGPIGLSVINAAKKENKKTISYIHSVEWELVTMAAGFDTFKRQSYWLAKSVIRRIYNKVDLLVFPAQSVAEVFTWHQIAVPKEVIHLGVDTKRFQPPASKVDAKKKLVLEKDIFIIGYHGRIAREKDLLTLLRAFILVKKQNPKVALLIVGDGLESVKRKLASVRGVMLPGATNNVVPYVQAMDVFCLPSLTETTSLTTLEAMACGVPVITNRVGFVKDYIKDGKNGLFFTAKDSYGLARQILLLMKDAELRKKLSENGRKFVEKEFDWALTAKKLDGLFSRMLQQT